MKIAILAAKEDMASMTIKKSLLDNFAFKDSGERFDDTPVYLLDYAHSGGNEIRLYTTETESIFCEDYDKKIDAELFVFATKHRAASGIPSLSVHVQGNWGKAELGGKDRDLAIAPAAYLKQGLLMLDKNAKAEGLEGFEIIQECTHHGPAINKMSMFIEIGSSEEQWKRDDAGKVIAKTIIELLGSQPPTVRSAVGLGGLHHTPNFKKIVMDGDIAIGHVCPKYNLENLDEEMLRQAIERCEPKASIIILDWKGLKDAKDRVKAIAEKTGLEIMRTKEF